MFVGVELWYLFYEIRKRYSIKEGGLESQDPPGHKIQRERH